MLELTNETLLENTVKAAAAEKTATLTLLEHLAEIDRRKLYADRGYASLWEYVHKALGYSEWQTSERVSAMRLIVCVPEVKKELEAGRLTLTTTAKLGMHSRKEKLRKEETLSLLSEVSGKSSREVERVLVANCTAPPKMTSVRAVTADVSRITIDVDQEFLMIMERVRELCGNPASSPHDLFLAAMKEYVKKREPKTGVKVTLGAQGENAEVPPKQTRYISKSTRDLIRGRSGDQCEYVDRTSKRRCECRAGLQFDHIKPYALDGGNEASNLRHYCATHNRLAAREVFGYPVDFFSG